MQSFEIKASAAQLMVRARETTAIGDIIDDDIEEALQRLLHALNTEAELTQPGAQGMEGRILTILCNRLRMQRDFARYPEINEQKIVRPHFLTGAGRSGSTKLHKLLAASGDFKFLRFWQQFNPSLRTGNRIEDPSGRVQEAQEFIRWFNQRAASARLIHAYETFEPEEETFLFDHTRFMINFNITHASLPSYMQWCMAQDMGKQLEFLKQAIKYLQWQFYDGDARPWVLKNPLYCGLEPLLMQVFPDAVFIATHREPGSRVSSSAGLTTCMQKAYSDADRSRQAGPVMLEFMAMAAMQYLAGRDAYPDVRILDIGYTELTKNPESVAGKVYAFAERDLSGKARQSMRDWEHENSQYKHGVYKHALENYAITQEMVTEKFRPYIERFGHYF
jgi:Sulfotransferase family